jgi:hypothetical protein
MLYGDDVVWLMWQEGIFFMKKAIFTSVTGAFYLAAISSACPAVNPAVS